MADQRCIKCDEKIEREVVTFNSKPYHRGCFTCHQCRFELSGKPIFSHEGNEFCEKCYGLFHAKRCAVCFEPLTDTNEKNVVYDNKNFHRECFCCFKCKQSVAGEKFYLNGDNRVCQKCVQ